MDSRVPENDDYGMRSFADSADESAQYLPPIESQYSEVPTMDGVPGEAGNPQEFYNLYVVEGSPGDFEQFRSSPQHLPPPPSQHSLRYPQQDRYLSAYHGHDYPNPSQYGRMNEMATFNHLYAQGQYNTLPAAGPQFNAGLDYGDVQHVKPLLRFEGRLYQDIGPDEEESALGMTLPQPGYLGAAQVVDVMRASSATTSSAARPKKPKGEKKLRTEQDDYYLPRVCLTKAEMDAIRACHTREPKRAFRGKPTNHKGWVYISLSEHAALNEYRRQHGGQLLVLRHFKEEDDNFRAARAIISEECDERNRAKAAKQAGARQ